MDHDRRRVLRLCGLPALAALAPRRAFAQSYPTRPVRFVVGFPAGGPNDILGRLMAEWLSKRLGQPFVVDNRPGGSSNPATEEVVRAPADGYTMLLVGPANAINASMFPDLGFNVIRDIAPVAGITREPLVLLVHPSLPVHSVAELIAHAKAHPRQVTMASTGQGSSPHVSGELFRIMTGVEVTVAHYAGGGPALKEMIAGHAQAMFEPMSAAIEPVRSGKLRAIGVTTAARSPALPGVPTVGETVPGYEASATTGIGVPRNTPADIIETLNRAVNAAFTDETMKARLADTGGNALPGTPADFGKLFAEETEKWGRVVKASGAKAR